MKKLFLLFTLITFCLILGFSLYNWNDKPAVADYINSGGLVTTNVPNYIPIGDEVPGWTLGSNMPAPTRYHGSGVTYTRNDTSWLYCLGGDETGSGNNSNVLSIYNITSNTWSTGAPQPAPTVFYNAAARLGDTIYQTGGLGDGGSFASMVNNVHRYHIPTNTWSPGRNLPNPIADAECEAYQDSLIYIIGGVVNGTMIATTQVWLYNRTTGYRAATPLPVQRSGHASAIIGDTIVVVCGGTGYNTGLTNTTYRGVISQSDRAVITWTTGVNYPGANRHRFDGDKWGCLGMIMGPGSAAGYTPLVECYTYSPGANLYSPIPNAPAITSSSFYGSVKTSVNVWRWVVASGVILSPPYSIPLVQILRDTLCPPLVLNQCRRGLNIIIPDNFLPGVLDTIRVVGNAACTLTDINIRIDTVFHTWDSDLQFAIIHNSTARALITRRGGSGDNFIHTVMDDQAQVHISNGVAPFTGSFRPEQNLNGAITGSPSGPWVLRIVDDVAADTGILKSWCVEIQFDCPTGGPQTLTIPNDYRLKQNYPNPFNPTTKISFGLPKASNVKLAVYDVLGREVRVLVNEERDAGFYEVSFDATNLSSGIYFYRLEAGDFSATRKMLVVK